MAAIWVVVSPCRYIWTHSGCGAVRYHLAIAAAAEPSIRDDHSNATRPAPTTRITPAGLQNLHDTIALYRAEDRFPSSKSSSARERALATWLLRRRQDQDRGTLSPTYSDGLQEIPGWEQRTRASRDEARGGRWQGLGRA